MSVRRGLCLTAIMLAAVLVDAGSGWATGHFTLRSVKGTYGFSGQGTLGGAPAAVVGLNSFDGAGGCEVQAKLNLVGTILPLISSSCSYTVNPDGTGAVSMTFPGPIGPLSLPEIPFVTSFVIADGGHELPFILSDTFGGGTVASGVATRQHAD